MENKQKEDNINIVLIISFFSVLIMGTLLYFFPPENIFQTFIFVGLGFLFVKLIVRIEEERRM